MGNLDCKCLEFSNKNEDAYPRRSKNINDISKEPDSKILG